MKRTLRSLIQLAACLVLGFAFTSQAQDKKVDVTGTWKSSFTAANGQTRRSTIKIKQAGDQLSGISIGQNGSPVDLKNVEGGDFEAQEDGEIDGKLPQMIIRDGSLKANIEGKVESQN